VGGERTADGLELVGVSERMGMDSSGSLPRLAEASAASQRLREETFRRSLGLLVDTHAELQVLLGKTNCLGVEALQDDLDLSGYKFQVVSAELRACSDFIVVLEPGWEAYHRVLPTACSTQAGTNNQAAQSNPCYSSSRCCPQVAANTAVTPPRPGQG